jgi:hypothetical protein
MRRRRRNHQKQPTIDRLEAALGTTPASRRRAAPGASRVTAAPGRMKTVEPSSSENRAPDDFFSTRLPVQGSSGGSACPHGSGPNENHRADVEDLAKPGRCKATPI